MSRHIRGNFLLAGGQNNWLDYGVAENWRVGSMDGAVASRVPGVSDTIGYPQNYLYADLGGKDWTIGTYDQDASPRAGTFYLCVRNGSLTIKNIYEQYVGRNEIYDGGTLTIAAPDMYEARWNAGYVQWTVHNGGRLVIQPKRTNYFQSYYHVEEGGTLVLNAEKYTLTSTAWPNFCQNRGNLEIVNGLTFEYQNALNPQNSTNNNKSPFRARNGFWSYFAIDHFGGNFKLGGTFSNGGNDPLFGFFLALAGGTVEVVKDAKFIGFDCSVADNSEVAINTHEGANMDMTTFKYGTNAALVKQGEGSLTLGSQAPSRLTVNGGLVNINDTLPSTFMVKNGARVAFLAPIDIGSVVFENGAIVVCGNQAITLNSAASPTDITFVMDSARIMTGVVFFRSTDAAIRSHVRQSIRATLDAAYDILEEGDGLYLVAHSDNIFDMSAGKSLNDPSAWGTQRVPVGEDVILRGTGKVIMNAETPQFASIKLDSGAELQVEGGTASAPIAMPMISLHGKVKLRFAEGCQAQLFNGLECQGQIDSLPIFEVATNAVLAVKDPTYPNRGIYFSNVDFRLYGQLTLPVAEGNDTYLGSQIFFGYAEDGETSFIAFTTIGGLIYCPQTAANYAGNRSLVSIASPAPGGRVKVVGQVMIKDYRKIWDMRQPTNPQCNFANSGYFIGVNNPVDETFEVVVDNCILVPGGPTKIAGGAQLKFVNGGDLRIPEELVNNASNGHTRGAFMEDDAVMEFDGGKLMLFHGCGNASFGKGFTFNAAKEGATQLKLKGGAQITLWEMYGNGKGVCEVMDGVFNVPRYLPPRWVFNATTHEWYIPSTWVTENTPAFQGFGSINVLKNGKLRFNATDEFILFTTDTRGDYPSPVQSDWWTRDGFWEWNRKTALAIPVTGEGDVEVINTLSGYDMRNYNGWVAESVMKFPELSAWEMNLVVRSGANTCTGEITADSSVKAYVHFANGANWAGTVKANGNVRLGDPMVGDAPAEVDFHALNLVRDLPLRVWKSGSGIVNDKVNLETAVTGTGALNIQVVEGSLVMGESFDIGTYPADAELPKVRKCTLTTQPIEGQPGRVRLTATYGRGFILLFK